MSPMADISSTPKRVSVLRPITVGEGINVAILADGNLSFVLQTTQGRAALVLTPSEARPIADLISRACAANDPAPALEAT